MKIPYKNRPEPILNLSGMSLVLDFGERGLFSDDSGNWVIHDFMGKTARKDAIEFDGYALIPPNFKMPYSKSGFFILTNTDNSYAVFDRSGKMVRKCEGGSGHDGKFSVQTDGNVIFKRRKTGSKLSYDAIEAATGKILGRIIDESVNDKIGTKISAMNHSPLTILGEGLVVDFGNWQVYRSDLKPYEHSDALKEAVLNAKIGGYIEGGGAFFKEGFISLRSKYGDRLISKDGRKVSGPYDDTRGFNEGKCLVRKGSKIEIIDTDFKTVTTLIEKYEDGYDENDGREDLRRIRLEGIAFDTFEGKIVNGKAYFDGMIYDDLYNPTGPKKTMIWTKAASRVAFVGETEEYIEIVPVSAMRPDNIYGGMRILDKNDNYAMVEVPETAYHGNGLVSKENFVKITENSVSTNGQKSVKIFKEASIMMDVKEINGVKNLYKITDRHGKERTVFLKNFENKDLTSGKIFAEDVFSKAELCVETENEIEIWGKKFKKKLLKI